MIEAKGIYKSFGNVEVIKGIDLHIDKGEIVTIVGASGAGKSTLLQIIGTLEKADKGEVSINKMKKDLSLEGNFAEMGLGWLSREDKLEYTQKAKSVTVKLR